MTSNQISAASDEIDLIELTESLLRQRLLISLFVGASIRSFWLFLSHYTFILIPGSNRAGPQINIFGSLGRFRWSANHSRIIRFHKGDSLANETS